MFNLQDIMIPVCSALPSSKLLPDYYSMAAPLDQLLNSSNVLVLLSLLFLCLSLYSLVTEVKEARAFTKDSLCESTISSAKPDNLKDDPTEVIELRVICVAKGPPDHECLKLKVVSPELTTISPLVIEDSKPIISKNDSSSSTNSEYINESDCTTLAPEDKRKLSYAIWYMRWNLTDQEIQSLNYSEKARRFSQLKTFDEVKKDPDEHHKHEDVEVFGNEPSSHPLDFQSDEIISLDGINDCKVTYESQSPKIPIPMNFLSDLVTQSNQIDVFQFQMDMLMLKINSILTSSFLKEILVKRQLNSPLQSQRYYKQPPFISHCLISFQKLKLKMINNHQEGGDLNWSIIENENNRELSAKQKNNIQAAHLAYLKVKLVNNDNN